MVKKPDKTDARTTSHPKSTFDPAAARALAEAEQRRKARELEGTAREKEIGGYDGPDPARYGDWEKDGIVSDF